MTRGAVLIVKNEAATIQRCLASARAAGVETFTVVDTGSTDGTEEIALAQNEHGRIWVHNRPWVNFGHNRSEAFALARGTADWLLALDADMTVEWDQDFEPDPNVAAYELEMHDSGEAWRLPLLLRGDLPWISRGAVHEYTLLADGSIGHRVPTDSVRIANHGEARWSIEKLRWHASLLEADLATNPNDPRNVFYLGQTYRMLGDPRAADLYRRRMTMGGWEEERWYAQYRLALMEDWPARLTSLMAAWEVRWHRPEPLYDLLRDLNSRDLHAAAYGLSSWPVPPTADILFRKPWVWDWGLAFERSIAAWWTGHGDEFAELTATLLANPRLPLNIRGQVVANAAIRAA